MNETVKRSESINPNIKLEGIYSLEALNQELNSGLITLYQDAFGEPPYEEVFTNQEVRDIFTDYWQADGNILLAKDGQRIVGFGVWVPVEKSSIADIAAENPEIIPKGSAYMADLAVAKEYRQQGIAKRLIQARIDQVSEGTLMLMRTSTAENNYSRYTYETDFGFTPLPFTQMVESMKQDGTTRADERMFLAKVKVNPEYGFWEKLSRSLEWFPDDRPLTRAEKEWYEALPPQAFLTGIH